MRDWRLGRVGDDDGPGVGRGKEELERGAVGADFEGDGRA